MVYGLFINAFLSKKKRVAKSLTLLAQAKCTKIHMIFQKHYKIQKLTENLKICWADCLQQGKYAAMLRQLTVQTVPGETEAKH